MMIDSLCVGISDIGICSFHQKPTCPSASILGGSLFHGSSSSALGSNLARFGGYPRAVVGLGHRALERSALRFGGVRWCRSLKISSGGRKNDETRAQISKIQAISVENSKSVFDVQDPWLDHKDAESAWEVLRNDVLYLDYRARQDVLAIKDIHDKMVDALNPVRREQKSVAELKDQLEELQKNLETAHVQVHASEARVEHTLRKLDELTAVVEKQRTSSAIPATEAATVTVAPKKQKSKGHTLNVTGPVRRYPAQLKNYWYPIAFSRDIDEKTMVPFDCFEEPWVIFRGEDGRPGCLRDECAHRACPLSLGTISNGQAQCAYHGWEFNTAGKCTKMPSTKLTAVRVQSLPCVEKEGLIWVWPGNETPDDNFPSLCPPKNYTIHAELVLELPVEHGLLVENLLDLAHAPFTHTSTFAKGWSVPDLVRFKTMTSRALAGHWDPYPISMEFRPPCMVLSTIGLAKPGQLQGSSAPEFSQHLFQMHACVPSSPGKTRLLYRMGLDFAQWVKHVPFIDRLWMRLANQVLDEDMRLVLGQQDRMGRGANVWNHPVIYDKLGVKYRRWRNAVTGEGGEGSEGGL